MAVSDAPPNVKRKLSTEEDKANKMIPSLFLQCRPISAYADIEDVIKNPPEWVKRVEPLVPRSGYVVRNTLSGCHTEHNRFSVRNRLDARTVPKTLVCHDYKGGYQEDKYLHYPHEEIIGNGYTFYNWAQIDVFVYFSHHFITIPTLCWINAAHTNGVKILGTLITENQEGRELCSKIFKDKETAKTFARTLLEITKIFGFDGWLLNIENPIENVDALKEFLHYFTCILHEANPGNLVIWYDSVTEGGYLTWQNELNAKNKYFFDSCDGIYLNYSWNEQNLINSMEEAKHRNFDVYVGLDVFGRNFYGGGMFNTYKALEVVTRYKLSVAIFAPGWTHETLEPTDKFFEHFYSRDSAFWCSLWPYLYTHPVNYYFTTNFYVGLDERYYNLFSQQQQLTEALIPSIRFPEYSDLPNIKNRCDCLQNCVLGSKNACLISKRNLRRDVHHIHYLFAADLEIVGETIVYFLTKSYDSAVLGITLLVCGDNSVWRKIKLLTQPNDFPVNDASVLEVNPNVSPVIVDELKNTYYDKIVLENWKLSVYVFKTTLCQIMEIGGVVEHGDSLYLGIFAVEQALGYYRRRE